MGPRESEIYQGQCWIRILFTDRNLVGHTFRAAITLSKQSRQSIMQQAMESRADLCHILNRINLQLIRTHPNMEQGSKTAFITSIRPKFGNLGKSTGLFCPNSPKKCRGYAVDSNIHQLGSSWNMLVAPELLTPTKAKKTIAACFSPRKLDNDLTPQLEDVMEDNDKFELLKQNMRANSGCFTPMSLGEHLGELLDKTSSHSSWDLSRVRPIKDFCDRRAPPPPTILLSI